MKEGAHPPAAPYRVQTTPWRCVSVHAPNDNDIVRDDLFNDGPIYVGNNLDHCVCSKTLRLEALPQGDISPGILLPGAAGLGACGLSTRFTTLHPAAALSGLEPLAPCVGGWHLEQAAPNPKIGSAHGCRPRT